MNYRKIGNITIASGWAGTVSCGYVAPHVGMIWGRVQKTSTGTPAWGEKVLSISDFPTQWYYHTLNVFLSSGTVINSLALTPQGTINCYPPDYDKIEPDKFYHI